jgi:hypothetical protein
MIKLTWQCEECNDIVTSYSHLRHSMDYCKCGKSAVDLEEHYRRNIGKVKDIKSEETNN